MKTFDLSKLKLKSGSHKVTIKAKSTGFRPAETGATFKIAKPSTPTISLSGSTITVTAEGDVSAYYVYVGSTMTIYTSATIDLSTLGLSYGTHKVYVKAFYKSGEMSAASNEVRYTKIFKPLEVPLYSVKDDVLTITPVADKRVTAYKVYINNSLVAYTSDTVLDLSAEFTGYKSYIVRVSSVDTEGHKSNKNTTIYTKEKSKAEVSTPVEEDNSDLSDVSSTLLGTWICSEPLEFVGEEDRFAQIFYLSFTEGGIAIHQEASENDGEGLGVEDFTLVWTDTTDSEIIVKYNESDLSIPYELAGDALSINPGYLLDGEPWTDEETVNIWTFIKSE